MKLQKLKPTRRTRLRTQLGAMLMLYVMLITLIQTSAGQTEPGARLIPVPPDVNNPVVVDQTYVDDSNKAFDEVLALREAAVKAAEAQGASRAERAVATVLIGSFDRVLAIKNQEIDAHKQLELLLQGMIKIQQDFIAWMQLQLMKPKKNIFQKILSGIKRAAEMVLGVLAGAGLKALLGSNYRPEAVIPAWAAD
jgi:hypothetical protein